MQRRHWWAWDASCPLQFTLVIIGNTIRSTDIARFKLFIYLNAIHFFVLWFSFSQILKDGQKNFTSIVRILLTCKVKKGGKEESYISSPYNNYALFPQQNVLNFTYFCEEDLVHHRMQKRYKFSMFKIQIRKYYKKMIFPPFV